MSEVASKTYAGFRSSVRAQARSLFKGYADLFSFTDGMLSALHRGYRQAWLEGAKECGITEGELKETELNAINAAVNRDAQYLPRFGDWILMQAGKDAKISVVLKRADVWANAYNGMVSESNLVTCADKKFRWDLGMTERHCKDCLTYYGRIYRGSTWNSVGARPQARALECNGYNCDCKLTPTDEPAWPGRPPRPTGG